MLGEAGQHENEENWILFTHLYDLLAKAINDNPLKNNELVEFFTTHIFWSGRNLNENNKLSDVKEFVRRLANSHAQLKYVFCYLMRIATAIDFSLNYTCCNLEGRRLQ